MARARVRAAVAVYVLFAGLVNFRAPASLPIEAGNWHVPRCFTGLGIGALLCQRFPKSLGVSRVSCKNAPFDYKGVLNLWAMQEHVKYNVTMKDGVFQCKVKVQEGGDWLEARGEPARRKKQAEKSAAESLCVKQGWATNAASFKNVLHERVMQNLQDAYDTKRTMQGPYQSTLELFNMIEVGEEAPSKVEAEQNVAKKWCEELRLACPVAELDAKPGSQSNPGTQRSPGDHETAAGPSGAA
mmetsp:Transcript_40865/g.73821  ORF Transcript_40865/g.73821 Transcript_40865/m.73821 type:complete len:242 (+) Transcript_40865:57-782(+)